MLQILQKMSCCPCLEGWPPLGWREQPWDSTHPCFCGWVPQGMPHSAAVAVLQVECKWLQLAGTGVDHVIYSAISSNCLFVIAVYLQCCNLSGLYQTWNYGLQVWRKLEKEEGMICKISWSYTYFLGVSLVICYLLYESSNTPFEPLGTSYLSCLPLKSFSRRCLGLTYKATPDNHSDQQVS